MTVKKLVQEKLKLEKLLQRINDPNSKLGDKEKENYKNIFKAKLDKINKILKCNHKLFLGSTLQKNKIVVSVECEKCDFYEEKTILSTKNLIIDEFNGIGENYGD